MDLDNIIEIIYINGTYNDQIKFNNEALEIYSERVSYFINFQDNKIDINFNIYEDIYEVDDNILYKYKKLLFEPLDCYSIYILQKYVVMYNTEKTQLDKIIALKEKINSIYEKYKNKFIKYMLNNVDNVNNVNIIDNIDMFKCIHEKYYPKFYKNIIDLTGLNINKYFIEYYFYYIYCPRYTIKHNCKNFVFEYKKEIKTNLEIIFF